MAESEEMKIPQFWNMYPPADAPEQPADFDGDDWLIITWQQKLWLECGWLVIFIAVLLGVYLISKVRKIVSSHTHRAEDDAINQASRESRSGMAYFCHQFTTRKTMTGIIMDRIIGIVVLANFFTYALLTETEPEAAKVNFGQAGHFSAKYQRMLGVDVVDGRPTQGEDWDPYGIWKYYLPSLRSLDWTLEWVAFFLILVWYIMCVIAVPENPQYRNLKASYVQYCCLNIFRVVDLIVLWTVLGDLMTEDHWPNLIFLRLINLCESVMNSNAGVGIKVFKEIFSSIKGLLAKAAYLGCIIWMLLSTLFYVTEKNNEGMDLTFESGDYPAYNRYGSIPSSAYYTFVTLQGEMPQADNFTEQGRFVVVLALIFGVSFIAISTGLFGGAFNEYMENKRDEEVEDVTLETQQYYVLDVNSAYVQSKLKIRSILDSKLLLAVQVVMWFTSLVLYAECTKYRPLDWENVATVDGFSKDHSDEGYLNTLRNISFLYCIFYLIEYVIRIYIADLKKPPIKYIFSGRGFLDLLAFLPEMIAWRMTPYGDVAAWLHAMSILRIYKLDRSIKTFLIVKLIAARNVGIFIVTFTVTFILWVFFSVAMYYCERNSVVGGVQEHFATIPKAMWMMFLDLCGEAPLNDHSAQGKAVHALVMMFSSALFTIPMGIIATEFQTVLEETEERDLPQKSTFTSEECEEPEREGLLQDGPQSSVLKRTTTDLDDYIDDVGMFSVAQWNEYADSTRGKVFRFLQGSRNPLNRRSNWFGLSARVYQSVYLIAVTIFVILTQVLTLEYFSLSMCSSLYHGEFAAKKEAGLEGFKATMHNLVMPFLELDFMQCMFYRSIFTRIQIFLIYAFFVDWLTRLVVCRRPVKMVGSFVGVVDLISSCGCLFFLVWVTIDPLIVEERFYSFARLCAALRLVSFDHYFPTVSIMGGVASKSKVALMHAAFALVAIWITFATVIQLVERSNLYDDGGILYAERFQDLYSAAPYTMVHLTGDFPLVNYSMSGRLVLICALTFAVCFMAVPAGIFAGAFSEELKKRRQAMIQEQVKAAVLIQKMWRGLAARRYVDDLMMPDPSSPKIEKVLSQSYEYHLFNVFSFKGRSGHTWSGVLFTVVFFQLVMVMLQSVKEVREYFGETFWVVIEVFIWLFCLILYVLRMYSIPMTPLYRGWRIEKSTKSIARRWRYFRSAQGLTELMCWLPGLLVITGLVEFGAWYSVAQMFRICLVEQLFGALGAFKQTFKDCKDTLFGLVIIATFVCAFCAASWYEAEGFDYNSVTAHEEVYRDTMFTSAPTASYYTIIFLSGEWCEVDFGIWGKVLQTMFCLIFVAIFSMPVAAISESLSDQLTDISEKKNN